MNKKLFTLASILMVISLALAGCGTTATPEVIEKQVEVTKIVEVTSAPAAVADEGGEIAVIVKTGNSSF